MRLLNSGQTLSEVAQAIDLPLVDPHHHLCFLSEASYPWLEGEAVPRYHGDDRALRRDYTRQHYHADFAGLPLIDSVVVENGAADDLWEATRLDLECGPGRPSCQVAHVDLAGAGVEARLNHLATLSSVRGVRDILNWHADPYFSHRADPAIIDDPRWRSGFAMLATRGLSFDMQVYPAQLPRVADLAARHPETRIVLDHCGMPIGRDVASMADWRRGLAAVAANANVFVKLSAVGTNDHDWTLDSLREVIEPTIDIFGPRRAMFASNFPVDGLYSSLPELYGAFWSIAARYSRDEQRAMFATTAQNCYQMSNPKAKGAQP